MSAVNEVILGYIREFLCKTSAVLVLFLVAGCMSGETVGNYDAAEAVVFAVSNSRGILFGTFKKAEVVLFINQLANTLV